MKQNLHTCFFRVPQMCTGMGSVFSCCVFLLAMLFLFEHQIFLKAGLQKPAARLGEAWRKKKQKLRSEKYDRIPCMLWCILPRDVRTLTFCQLMCFPSNH